MRTEAVRLRVVLYNPRAVFWTMLVAVGSALDPARYDVVLVDGRLETNPLRWPASVVSRWRVQRNFYALPLEKALMEGLRPAQRLS